MKVKKAVVALAAAAAATFASIPAHALIVLDGWQLKTATTLTTNIGRLNLVSGSAVVEQEVLGTNVFVGAEFRESGQIFSISYTPENVVGPLDTGFPSSLPTSITIAFTGVTGFVDALVGSGAHLVFTGGSYTISSGDGSSASGSVVGLDGTLSTSSTISGATGATTLIGSILSSTPGFDMRDSTGASLLADLASGKVFFEVTTNNQVTAPFATGACSFDPLATCVKVNAASAGDAYLAELPEPGSVALVGAALLAAGGVARRNRKVKSQA